MLPNGQILLQNGGAKEEPLAVAPPSRMVHVFISI